MMSYFLVRYVMVAEGAGDIDLLVSYLVGARQ